MKRWQCYLRLHQWNRHQVAVNCSGTGLWESDGQLVIAFVVCQHCACSKLVHILK